MRVLTSPKRPTTSSRLARRLGAAALIAGVALSPIAAQAGEDRDPNRTYRSVEVQINDLNLESDAGQKTLQRRIKYAAREVCRPAPRLNLRDHSDYRRCMTEALDSGREAIVEVLAAKESGTQLASSDITIFAN
ncbi:MAG: UrcA family protein [Pseudomonadota bacterium]